ncbi:hypothetical protein B0J17DRAFT_682260 [Rhizoctonia solani]|nr:hypothetical protein B0J17DRAFT_682260 [Rhizoctonia solani]
MSSDLDVPPLTQRAVQASVELRAFLDSLANASQALTGLTETLADIGQPLEERPYNSDSDGEDQSLTSEIESDSASEVTRSASEATKASRLNSVTSSSSSFSSRSSHSVNVPQSPSNPLEIFKTTSQKQGNFYIILEEDFDALPLIALYASHCSKVVCYAAVPESARLWKKILSNVVRGRQVLSRPSNRAIKRLGSTFPRLTSGSVPFTLPLAFKVLSMKDLDYSPLDCLLFWGLPSIDYVIQYVVEAADQARHACFILTAEEYNRPSIREKISSLNAIRHPASELFNTFVPTNVLFQYRESVRGQLGKSQHYKLIQTAYHNFYIYHHAGRGCPGEWNSSQLIDQANRFAARVLLRRSLNDGSQRFKPVGPKLELKSSILKLIKSSKVAIPKPSDSEYEEESSHSDELREISTEPVSNFTRAKYRASTRYSKHTYIVLEENFDALPLIGYLADTHAKIVCYISHCKKVTHSRHMLEAVTSRTVVRPGKQEQSMITHISRLGNSTSGFVLFRGDHASPSQLKNSSIDLVICYGLSSPGNFHTQINMPKATRAVIILPKEEASMLTNAFVSKRKLEPYPDSAQLTAYGSKSPLLPY